MTTKQEQRMARSAIVALTSGIGDGDGVARAPHARKTTVATRRRLARLADAFGDQGATVVRLLEVLASHRVGGDQEPDEGGAESAAEHRERTPGRLV